tara:strand:+ start:15261 stop:16559 length:1299 start_codon:yes stop_codon:yes gene_type:complete
MAEEKVIETKVKEVDVNIDEIFDGVVTSDSVTLPEEEKSKPNVFSRGGKVDLSFLNEDDEGPKEEKIIEEPQNEATDLNEKAEVKEETEEESTEEIKVDVKKEEIDEILSIDEEEQTEKKKPGRKKIEGIADVFTKLIKDEKIIGFDDDKDLSDYSAKDWEELIEANLEEKANAVRRETPAQFFNSLPQELQIAAKYVADGGQDLKSLFQTLAQVEETRDLNVKTQDDQEYIIREYLAATGYGNREEIDEEIELWKDLGKLEQQAKKFKPKLDKMQEKVVAAKLKEQEMKKAQQQKASQDYMENVYNTLKEGKLNDVKIDKKVQSMLYNGLVNPQYPSISGKNTNLLGHLLEKYQFVEPNYSLISEALWLLADPDSYKSQIMTKGETAAVEKTVRKLKTAQASKQSSTKTVEPKDTRKKLSRNSGKNIFKRF